MVSPFSFRGQIGRLPYALWSVGVFFSQHLVTLIAFRAHGLPLPFDRPPAYWSFYITPLRELATLNLASDLMLILALGYLLIVAWALAALSFRRAATANISEWIAAAAIAPVVQIPVILILCLAPHRAEEAGLRGGDTREDRFSDWSAAAQGSIAGLGLTLASVAVGALVFGTYGYGLFVISPFVIGAVTAYLGNRRHDIGQTKTLSLVAGATALGGIALFVFALEGIVCLILAAPLGFGVALIGGALGLAIARYTRRTPRQTLSGLALLPLVFAIENVMSATASFDTAGTTVVNAPPQSRGKAIVSMETKCNTP